MTAITYQGDGSKVTLDPEAQTLTFEHTGMRNSKARKRASPWVIPLGAIETIEWREKKGLKAAEFRPILHGRAGFDDSKLKDLSYLSSSLEKVAQFVEAVEAARSAANPVVDFVPGELAPTLAPESANKGILGHLASQTVIASFQGAMINGDSLHYRLQKYPLAGARANVDVGGTKRRTTATRVVVGSAITLGVGTAIGAMAKKKTSSVYLTVEFADGDYILIEADAKAEPRARKFAASVNQAAAITGRSQGSESAVPPPPPPGVPEGWYPDPSDQPVQRYWDGSDWTEHTAPLAPS
jgi:hypothetical protein